MIIISDYGLLRFNYIIDINKLKHLFNFQEFRLFHDILYIYQICIHFQQ